MTPQRSRNKNQIKIKWGNPTSYQVMPFTILEISLPPPTKDSTNLGQKNIERVVALARGKGVEKFGNWCLA